MGIVSLEMAIVERLVLFFCEVVDTRSAVTAEPSNCVVALLLRLFDCQSCWSLVMDMEEVMQGLRIGKSREPRAETGD